MSNQPKEALKGVSTKPGYKRENRGIPVEKGMTFKDLSYEQRRNYFIQHENHWRKKFNERSGFAGGVNQQFSRGV